MVILLPHQEEAMKETEGLVNTGVFYDMGLGKTYIGSEMMKRFGCHKNLIVCQASKVDDWIDHMCFNYPEYEIFNLRKKNELESFLQEHQLDSVGVINYDLVWRRKDLLKLKDFTLMLDESSLIQNVKSKRTKFILKLKPSHTILLSGTPVGGKYENLWSQMHLLGWNISQSLFDRQYINWTLIESGGFKHNIVDKANPYKNVDRLKAKIRSYGGAFKKTEEVIDLPKQNFIQVKINAPDEYWKFRKESFVMIDDVELVGDTTLTKLLYSRQICSQYNPNKYEAFKDLVESTNDRLVIFYNFDDELIHLKEICEELNRPISEVNGHRKDLTAYENESDSITLCQYQSASKGLNLQKSHQMIFFSLCLSSENYEQAKKRIHRIGQDHPCFYYILTCKGTIEEDILRTLKERKDYTDALFEEDEKRND